MEFYAFVTLSVYTLLSVVKSTQTRAHTQVAKKYAVLQSTVNCNAKQHAKPSLEL